MSMFRLSMFLQIVVVLAFGLTSGLVHAQPQDAPPKPQLPPGGSLSDKLDRSDGVVTPPANVDPGMAKPAPNSGAAVTPVIPPPGEPGGRQDIQPK